jgi:hypothetical protein
MLLKIRRNSTIIALLLVIIFSQFGCRSNIRRTERRLARSLYNRNTQTKPLEEKPVTWNNVVSAINTGLPIKTNAMPIRAYKQNHQISISIRIPLEQSNNSRQNSTPRYKFKSAYVNCQMINNDSAIIERNKLNNDGSTLISLQDQKKLVNFLREAALPECQKQISKS